MKKHFLFTAATALCLAALAPQACAQSTLAKLTHRSEFKDDGFRNPMWPIGWQKPANGTQDVSTGPQLPIGPGMFNVTSISISSAPLAVINGRTYAEGEFINAIYGGQHIKILVSQINDGNVVLQYLGIKFTVNQKRPDMMPKQSPAKDETPPDNSVILH
jgi:hypothetical protein